VFPQNELGDLSGRFVGAILAETHLHPVGTLKDDEGTGPRVRVCERFVRVTRVELVETDPIPILQSREDPVSVGFPAVDNQAVPLAPVLQ
jgi:hypothetical protein